MRISIHAFGGLTVAEISGPVMLNDTGTLRDVLALADGNLVVDLARVPSLARGAAGSLVATGRLAEARGGAMRISGARPPVADLLAGLGFNHLVKLDPDRATSVAALAPTREAAEMARELDAVEPATARAA